ncbi:MAG: IS30 family transposase [Pseudomonadota bacterium]|nr:IS30 family transposase [Pseudomonadota bacterium]
MKKYTHLTPEERAAIMLMLDQQYSLRKIGQILQRNPSTISREISRQATKSRFYNATQAAKQYLKNRQPCKRPKKLDNHSLLCDMVERHLIHYKWSPEQISANLKQRYPSDSNMQLSPETIYAHIYAQPKGELKKLMIQSLRRRKSKRGPRGSKDSCYSSLKISEEQRFMNRPENINTREVAGHWEGDLIIGAMNKSCVGTLVERKTGFVILSKMENKSAKKVRAGFEKSMASLQDFLRLSLTYDRGAEMAEHVMMSKTLKMDVYFADPHAPWQRGTSENTNGLIRQFLPKGEDLSQYSQSELDYVAYLLNNRPRKRYEFRTPQEMMEIESKGGLFGVALDS